VGEFAFLFPAKQSLDTLESRLISRKGLIAGKHEMTTADMVGWKWKSMWQVVTESEGNGEGNFSP